ncbi:unnamed protein product, partial [Candidula unifasciata]
ILMSLLENVINQMLFPRAVRRLFMHNSRFRRLSTSHTRQAQAAAALSLEYKNDVAIIRMENRNNNQMDSVFLREFHSQLDSVERNHSCRGLVTVGEGKFYSNGLDLQWMATISTQEVLDFMAEFEKLLLRVLILPVPTLAVINGHAFAGGAVLAFAHDLRTMNSEKGWLCLNEVLLDKVFSAFLKEYLRMKIGDGRNLSEALILAHRYTAAEAVENRLVYSIHPRLSLLDHSLQVLESFIGSSGFPHQGLLNMKKDIYELPLRFYETESSERFPHFAVQFMTEAQRNGLKDIK